MAIYPELPSYRPCSHGQPIRFPRTPRSCAHEYRDTARHEQCNPAPTNSRSRSNEQLIPLVTNIWVGSVECSVDVYGKERAVAHGRASVPASQKNLFTRGGCYFEYRTHETVSYTHLTLPTN